MPSLLDQFRAFEETPPADLFGDPIWRLPAYRLALFLADVALADTSLLQKTRCPVHVVGQLGRAVDSIGINITEGYSKYSGRERARYYEIALGSARESRDWYRRAIPWLGQQESLERAALLTRVIKILLVAVPQERNGATERRLRRHLRRSDTGESDPSSSSSSSSSPSPSTQDKQ